MAIRHKCFISYHHADEEAVKKIIDTYDHNKDIFISRRLGEMPDDIINSNDYEYVMQNIRKRFIRDSTVTIVIAGKCTWARKYVDWEIQSSLRSGQTITPNGLLGIKLPTFTKFPDRFELNLLHEGEKYCYASWIKVPFTATLLESAIDEAFNRRNTHRTYIKNPRDRYVNNRQCE